MINFNKLAISALALCAFASPALAQDMIDDPDANPFTGLYVGGHVGVGWRGNDDGVNSVAFDTDRNGDFNNQVNTSTGANAFTPGFCGGFSTANAPGSCANDRDKIDYGVRVGFDAQVGNALVIGVVGEANKNDSSDGSAAFSSTPAGYSFNRKIDNALSLRGRVGFTPGARFLVYGTGGVSWAKFDRQFSTTNTQNSFTEFDRDKRVMGYQVGGGAEVMLGRNISLGAEYLYSRYNDDKYFVAIGAGTALPTNPFLLNGGGTNFRPSNTDFGLHAIRATLSFRFR